MCIRDRNIHPQNVLDVRCLSSADIGSDHRLLFEKFRIITPSHMPRIPKYELRYSVDSFKQDSVKDLYERRIASKIQQIRIGEDDVEMVWKKSKQYYRSCIGGIRTKEINYKQ